MDDEWIVSMYSRTKTMHVSVKTLIGEYRECGFNHGKKVYTKK